MAGRCRRLGRIADAGEAGDKSADQPSQEEFVHGAHCRLDFAAGAVASSAARAPRLTAVAQAQKPTRRRSTPIKGADRDQRLVAAAKKEGTRHLLHVDADAGVRPAVEGVRGEIRHPGAALARDQRPGDPAHGQRGARRPPGARRAGDQRAGGRCARARECRRRFYTPHSADLPDWAKPKHRRWYAARANLWVVAFNTGKVKKEEIPPTYEGFVDPKWKGRIGIESTDQDWMYAVINYVGEERGMDLFRKLAAMRPDMRLGHALLAQLIARRRDPGRADGLFRQRRLDQEARRPDRLGRGRADRRPSAGARGRAQRAASRTRRCCSPTSCCRRKARSCSTSLDRNPTSKRETTLLSALQVPDGRSDRYGPTRRRKWEKLWQELFLKVGR